ncbi:MAG TPA: hypothetical protein VM802_04565 [Chitinophaga sp.]|uniref:hypothetical protein n=1 Tax=Chitinophaga sp. TaxID=1869181 RepID=UPI002B769F6C|nr:hypothetical protein [Chitinophaga sp.]HVI44112.1 hypothetical protein [Chitinophaga sp.]
MKKALIIVAVFLLAGVTVVTFSHQKSSLPADQAPGYNFNVKFDFNVPKNPSSAGADSIELINFAWDEFFALNWKSSYSFSKKRADPDRSWRYDAYNSSAPYPTDPVVWETYAHRTELRPYSNNMLPFDNPPHYSYKINIVPTPGATTGLFNNLDENNEIGSCDLYANTDRYGKRRQVLYQAKANRDEYDYLYNNYRDSNNLKIALANSRTKVMHDSAYDNVGSSCSCDRNAKLFCLPCGGADVPGTFGYTKYEGAVEVKTAWKEIGPSETRRYFTRKVITYKKVGNTVYADNKIYGLIGMHIIHKTLYFPNFIFATFEHVDVEADHMGYVLLGHGTPDSNPMAYRRAHTIPAVVDSSTAYVHRELNKKNPNSIWQYYRLVGVQGNPTNDTKSFSFFLANYVIESDSMLANFRGSNLNKPFNGGINSVYKRKGYSMGGCQGCHGVAQLAGTDCSFIMFFGGFLPVKAPDAGNSTDKLAAYKRLFEAITAPAKN